MYQRRDSTGWTCHTLSSILRWTFFSCGAYPPTVLRALLVWASRWVSECLTRLSWWCVTPSIIPCQCYGISRGGSVGWELSSVLARKWILLMNVKTEVQPTRTYGTWLGLTGTNCRPQRCSIKSPSSFLLFGRWLPNTKKKLRPQRHYWHATLAETAFNVPMAN